jgi:endonuclease/exonuclease/phosphatase family metal-dependent hydrolase
VLSRQILIVLSLSVIVACSTVEKQHRTVYNNTIEPDNAISIQRAYPDSVLRVATLNLAHGRKDSFNQVFVGKSNHKENLNDIADVLKKYKPHVVALQEADAPSRWSGSFDHVAYLASGAEYPWRTHVSNAESWLFSYGTALLSGVPFIETVKHTFESSPPTLDKGLVLAQIEWPSAGKDKSRIIDIISVHLDFSRQSVRDKQIDEIIKLFSARNNPTIIMGDFNSEWLAEASVIKELATNGRFKTHEPDADDYNTYKDKRLDWILITKDLEFVNYQVLPDTLSDHAMLVADICFKAITCSPSR